jgi:hypothetical protein
MPTNPFPQTAAALIAAKEAANSGVPYSNAIATSGIMAGFRQDCSGLADFVLNAIGKNVQGATTVTLPNYLQKGQGGTTGITFWDKPLPGQSGHVIMDIGGQWFESGGMSGGGPHQMTAADAAAELGVSSVDNIQAGTTPRGFVAYTPGDPTQRATLSQLWIDAGGAPKLANTMAAIAMAESSGNVGATNDNANGTIDLGLWQINSGGTNPAWPQYNPQQLLSDPLYNAQAAVAVERTQGLQAWTTYNNGAYKQFLGQKGPMIKLGPGPNGGIVRPGGQNAGAPSSSVPDALTAYTTLRDIPRTAPPGSKNPFSWWLASFTDDWDSLNTTDQGS